MEHTNDIRGADNKLIINVIRRSLRCIDERLIDHGERVAYIAGRIADAGLDGLNRQKLLVLSMLHDIGAFKTEEISNMVRFETDDVINHAVYGYVFLKHTTPLGRYAEAILDHHTRYDELAPLDDEYKRMAALIFLADRIDILLLLRQDEDFEHIRARSGTQFAPDMVELFFAAEEKFDIPGHIRDGSYKHGIDAQLDKVSVPEADSFDYLRMLVYSIDFRSPFTVTHTANTVSVSITLAELFGMSAQERDAIALGAFLHDVGKIVIPYSILENTGKLNDTDMALMRTHVTASEDILRGLVTDEVFNIAVRHHEKLNGTGYPHGLRAKDLTLSERIVAVADIMSALIGRRSYKEPFPKEKVVSILQKMSAAGELCPACCAMAEEHYDEIVRITNLYDDPVVSLYETIRAEYEQLIREKYGA